MANLTKDPNDQFVSTHLINNTFTHKLHFPPLVILPLVPAAKKRTNEYIHYKTSAGTLSFKLGLFEKHVSRLTQATCFAALGI